MLTYEEARKSVTDAIADYFGDTVVVDDGATIDKGYGWVFFYITKEAYETGIDFPMMGGFIYLIRKDTGEIITFPTWKPYEEFLRDYECNIGLK